MASAIIACENRALDRSIDVNVSVTKNQAEARTDLSVLLFATLGGNFRHGVDRVKFYTEFASLAEDFAASDEAYKAGQAFFSSTPRSQTFAVGRIFTAAQAGYAKYKGANTTIADWVAIADGSFAVAVDGGAAVDVTGCDFSAVTDMNDVNTVIQAQLTAAIAGATIEWNGVQFIITSPTTGATSVVSDLTAAAAGTDISGSGFMNGVDAAGDPTDSNVLVPGYTPTGVITDEFDLLAEAVRCSGRFVYGWAIEESYRDTGDMVLIAAWAEARNAIFGANSNNPLALDGASTTDVPYLLSDAAYARTFSEYHNSDYYYPEVALLAQMLSVDYTGINTVITAKFRDLIGIPTADVDITDVGVLEEKRCNTFTAVGNNARVHREGVMASPTYFIDERIGLDNLAEDLQVALYNVFLQHGRVAYNSDGLGLQSDAITRVLERYVTNGFLSEREVLQTSANANQVLVEPAYTLEVTPLSSMTVAERANRIGPPWVANVNLTGAIHSTSITINAFA